MYHPPDGGRETDNRIPTRALASEWNLQIVLRSRIITDLFGRGPERGVGAGTPSKRNAFFFAYGGH